MAVKWIEARQKKSADPPWTSKVTLIVDEFIELETAFESASGAHRETVMIAGKILAVSPPTQHGIMLELSFIGSDDPETADKMKDSNVNFHLCQLKPRQDGCKVTTDGVLHSEKFRKLSINDVRALGYAPKAVLDELAPPPPLLETAASSKRRDLKPLEQTTDPKKAQTLAERLDAKLKADTEGKEVEKDARGRVVADETATKEDTVKKALLSRREQEMQAKNRQVADVFLTDAKRIFGLIDVDASGKLAIGEILDAIKTNEKVVQFLKETPNKDLQQFLVPARVNAAMKAIDTDGDGEISLEEWDAMIEKALEAKLKKLGDQRVLDDAFSETFLSLANQVYDLIDVDKNETLEKAEMVQAVQNDEDVIEFLVACPNEELQDLLSKPDPLKPLELKEHAEVRPALALFLVAPTAFALLTPHFLLLLLLLVFSHICLPSCDGPLPARSLLRTVCDPTVQ